MRASMALVIIAACDHADVPDASIDAADVVEEFVLSGFDAGPDVVQEAASRHDAAPPDVNVTTTACLDAGACPSPPVSYCSNDYAVVFQNAACVDGGCVFAPNVEDCLASLCNGCFADDAGHAACSCITP